MNLSNNTKELKPPDPSYQQAGSGLPGNGISFRIVPLGLTHNAGLSGRVPAKNLSFSLDY